MNKKAKNATECIRLSPSKDTGLSSVQVKERTENGFTNKLPNSNSKSVFSIFVDNICTFFNLLGVLVCIALIIIGAQPSQFFFVLIYCANIFIGIIQELRAKHCIDKLSLLSNKTVKVVRDGEIKSVSSDEIVLDDVIELGLGSQIPADSIIIDGTVEVNESLLTGESVPVKKTVGDTVYAGSFITSGLCRARADEIGGDSFVEKLSEKAKQYKKPESELMNALRLIIKIIGVIILPIAVAWLTKSLLSGVDWKIALEKTATVVIGMIPSGMFLLTSMALAVGVIKLARHKTLVQDLYSLEMLARVDTVCFDKTGTLTDGNMTVSETVLLYDFSHNTLQSLISSMLFALKDSNQTAIALKDYFGDKCVYKAQTVLPFNSKRKLSAVTFENLGTCVFGAPEFVLSKKQYLSLKDKIDGYAHLGLRVLVVAQSKTSIENDSEPNDLIPIALITIADNIRTDAIDTVSWFQENDVLIKVISGDNPVTVSEVAKRTGINDADKYISLECLSDEEVEAAAEKYTVFGRVSPEQKALLLRTLKNEGHVTAMTGDGVNDILAMKEANCAISVASGSEAARNLSNIVLMDNNFASMPKVVHEGRRVINNVESSSSLFLMKTLFTMLLSIVVLCLPARTTYPFNLSQMIMLEVFIIGMPSFFLSLQPNDARVKGRFTSQVFKNSLPSALLMVLSVMAVELSKYILGVSAPITEETYSTMGVYALSFAGLINLFFICRPFNILRSILFATSFSAVTAISLIGIFRGLDMLNLSPMVPLVPVFWHHLLLVLVIILLDIPLSILLNKLCSKINFKQRPLNRKKTK